MFSKIWDEKPTPFMDETFESDHNGELLYEAEDMDAWLDKLWEDWMDSKFDAASYRSIKDIELDLISKMKFWGREEPSLVAQGLLGVLAIDTMVQRYIDQLKKLEALKKTVEAMSDEVEDEITLHHYKRKIEKILGDSEFTTKDEET